MDERERFEVWAKECGLDVQRFTDDYLYTDTKGAWLGWQAASAGRQELVEACEEALGALNGAEHALPGYVVAALERAIAKATGEQA